MKYVIINVLDQTVGFWSGEDWTTKHPEAILYETKEAAEVVLAEYCKDMRWADWYPDPKKPDPERAGQLLTAEEHEIYDPWIQEVENETEFRNKEDTW